MTRIEPARMIGWVVDIRNKDAEQGGVVVIPELTIIASDWQWHTLEKDGVRYRVPYGEIYSDEASEYEGYVLQTDCIAQPSTD